VVGIPTWFIAIRPAFEPPSSESTTPMLTSSIRVGSRLGFAASVARRTVARSSSGYASFSWPLYDRVMGVRREERMTISLGSFLIILVRPLRIGPDILARGGCFLLGGFCLKWMHKHSDEDDLYVKEIK